MIKQLHAPNAVLPVKWAIFHCKQGWVGPKAGPDRYEKGKISCPPPGFKSDCPACRYTIYAIPPASYTEGAGMSMAHSRGKNHENYTS